MSINENNCEKKLKGFVEEKVILTSQNAHHYIDAILKHRELVYTVVLCTICKNLRLFQKVLSIVDFGAGSNLNSRLVPFLIFLCSTCLESGSSKISVDECCIKVFESGVLKNYVLANFDDIIEKLAVAKFVSRVMMCSTEARDDENIKELANRLILIRFLPNELNAMLFPSSGSVEITEEEQGPKYDNDFPTDYRRVRILPTPEEIEYRIANDHGSMYVFLLYIIFN